MSNQNNSITIGEDGNITIQDVGNSSIIINTKNPDEVLNKLNQLNQVQIDSLLQVIENQDKRITSLFKTRLNGVAKEKNIVKGSISNIGVATIGDNNDIHYHYHHHGETKLSKELTLHIPKTHPDDIVGREADLKELHDLLSTQKRVVVVNGLGGIGKTTLAQVYVSKYYEEYKHIVWITQISESIALDFNNDSGLIKNLQIETGNLEPNENLEPEKEFKEILIKLKSIADKPNLLIIDNGVQSLSKYRHMLPSQPNWHLLITSREDITDFYIKPLGFLSEQQAIELFKKYYTHKKLTDQDIKELVVTVDYHTLTIEILAKTAQVQRYDAAVLKEAIEKDLKANVKISHKEDGKIEKIGSYLRSVFSLSKLSETEIWLLKQFACLPPEFHTYDLLQELLINEQSPYKETFAETLANIAQKGWLLKITASDSFKMHRIIAEVIRKELTISSIDIQNLIEVITSNLGRGDITDNPVNRFKWVSFGKTILKNIQDDTSDEITSLQFNLAIVLRHLGNFKEAKVLLEKAVQSCENKLGQNNITFNEFDTNLASVLQDLGDYVGAESKFRKALDWAEDNLGEDHPITANRINNLALVLKLLYEKNGGIILLKESKVLFEKVIKYNENNFGKNNIETTINYSNLAGVLQEMGEYENAKYYSKLALKWAEDNLGEDHPKTAIRNSNLARVLIDTKEYDDAILLLEKALQSDINNFGENHINVAHRKGNLAELYFDIENYPKALELTEQALSIYNKVLPEGHPTIETGNNYYRSLKQKLG